MSTLFGNLAAVNNVSLTVVPDAFGAVIGREGAGKLTFLILSAARRKRRIGEWATSAMATNVRPGS